MARKLHCSFCGKSEDEVSKLAAGPGGIHICNECVAVCAMIMSGDEPGLARGFDPATWPRERLLALLSPLNATSEIHRGQLQEAVDSLRRDEVSWAEIGKALGVSRQTAWERFG